MDNNAMTNLICHNTANNIAFPDCFPGPGSFVYAMTAQTPDLYPMPSPNTPGSGGDHYVNNTFQPQEGTNFIGLLHSFSDTGAGMWQEGIWQELSDTGGVTTEMIAVTTYTGSLKM